MQKSKLQKCEFLHGHVCKSGKQTKIYLKGKKNEFTPTSAYTENLDLLCGMILFLFVMMFVLFLVWDFTFTKSLC